VAHRGALVLAEFETDEAAIAAIAAAGLISEFDDLPSGFQALCARYWEAQQSSSTGEPTT